MSESDRRRSHGQNGQPSHLQLEGRWPTRIKSHCASIRQDRCILRLCQTGPGILPQLLRNRPRRSRTTFGLARFTIDLQTGRGPISFSRGQPFFRRH